MKKPENPAKVFLRQYLSLTARVDALKSAIDDAMSRAYGTQVTLKEVKVLSSPAEHDPMAKDVCTAVDACEELYKAKAEADRKLFDILKAIDSVDDETQKTLLTLRYITGCDFTEIMERMHYERSQVFVIHGRALVQVNNYLHERRVMQDA